MYDDQPHHRARSAAKPDSMRSTIAPSLPNSRVEKRWYANVDGRNYGPFGTHAIERMIQNDQILETDYLCVAGALKWMEAQDEPDFRALFQTQAQFSTAPLGLKVSAIAPNEATERVTQAGAQEAVLPTREEDSRRQDLHEFFGPRADKYLAVHDRMQSGGKRFALGWNWPVFFLGFPWFFYRKMYIIGALILIIPGLGAYLFGIPVNAGTAGFVAATFANRVYVSTGTRRIKKADLLGLVGEERRDYLRRAGGVSVIGAILAGSMLVAAFALLVFAEYLKHHKLPH